MTTLERLSLDVLARTPPPAAFSALALPEKIAALRHCTLAGISVAFQPYVRGHGEALRSLRNQPNNKQNLAQPADLTREQQAAWENGYFARADDLCWIVLTPTGEFAGAIALYDITAAAAETGRFVLREDVARASPAVAECELMIQWIAFGWLGLRTVVARIQPANTKMIAMHERLGFAVTGPSSIRGVPYTRFEINAGAFNPEAHAKVLRHWRERAATL